MIFEKEYSKFKSWIKERNDLEKKVSEFKTKTQTWEAYKIEKEIKKLNEKILFLIEIPEH